MPDDGKGPAAKALGKKGGEAAQRGPVTVNPAQRPPEAHAALAGQTWRRRRRCGRGRTKKSRAGASWERRGVAQFQQPHNLFTRFRAVSDEELPGFTSRLLGAGCVWVDYLDDASLPPTVTDRTPRPGDAALRFVTGRRPVLEWTAAAMAAQEPRVRIRRGVRAWELLTGASAIQGSPHVIGVQTTSGEIMHADLVVDAMGRRSHAGEWIKAVGGRSPHEEHEDNTFLYYT